MLTGLPAQFSATLKNWNNFLFTYGLLGSVNFLLFYFLAFFVIPRYFFTQKKTAWVFLIFFITAALFTLLKYYIEIEYFNLRMAEVQASIKSAQFGSKSFLAIPLKPAVLKSYLLTYVWFSLIIVLIAFSFQLLIVWYGQEKIRKELENQKLKAELSFLKLQINPHFLFNSLNNLYSLAVLEKAGKTSDGIMKLSDLIRYMLYEKEDEHYRVNLDKEIKHINSYIDLQKLRYEKDIYIQFSIEGDTTNKMIPSLLLFPIIENSCKHGILQDHKKPVSIQIKVTDNTFLFSTHNYKNNHLKDHTGGIGLGNVRKRLSLLYPGTHNLNIIETDTDFLVELKLPLT